MIQEKLNPEEERFLEKPVDKIEDKKIFEELQERPPLTIMSGEDVYVADRMKSQPKTIDEVLLVKERKFAPGEHRLSLPKELCEYQDRFAFRWINKKKRAIDDAIDLKGWVIVNKALFPNLPRHSFSTSGGIERGDTILMFMSLKKAEAMRRIPGEKSAQLVKDQLSKGEESLPKEQSGFYKPSNTSAEIEDTGLLEGRDF